MVGHFAEPSASVTTPPLVTVTVPVLNVRDPGLAGMHSKRFQRAKPALRQIAHFFLREQTSRPRPCRRQPGSFGTVQRERIDLKAMRKRQVWVEPLFGEGKQWHGMRRFRLRRLWRVNCEALMIASGQNLKRLLQKRGWGRRPFPTEAVALRPPGDKEADVFSKNISLKNDRVSAAVASLVSYEVERRVL